MGSNRRKVGVVVAQQWGYNGDGSISTRLLFKLLVIIVSIFF